MAGEKADRLWTVVLAARAAFRFEERQQISLGLTPSPGLQARSIRLRNSIVWATDDHSENAPTFVGGFVTEATGNFGDAEAAVKVLGNLASPFFQVMALATNAGVEEPEDLIAYSPPASVDDTGAFVIQRHSQARAPAARLRKVHAQDVMALIDKLSGHRREVGIQRAMAHYRVALNQLDPLNRVLSAESLWMAVENLSHVVLDRLRDEHGLPQSTEGKHQLALALGFRPKTLDNPSTRVRLGLRLAGISTKQLRADRSHLGKLDAHIRRAIILGDDDDCYRQLKDSSDGFEHGFMDFGLVQSKSKVADRAFTHIRGAILREIGLPNDSPLFNKRFDNPLGVWRPAIEVHGTYTDTDPAPLPTFEADAINEPWPDPPGLSLIPTMKSVVDEPDGTRNLTLEVNGSADGLTATQNAKIIETKWVAPGANDTKVMSKHVVAKLNGEIVYDEVELSADEIQEQPAP